MDFAIPAHRWEKIKEREKIEKYIDLAKELNPCETWVTVIPNIVCTLGVQGKSNWSNWKSEIKFQLYRLQHWWNWLEYSEDFWKTEETYCLLVPNERSPVKTGVKNLQRKRRRRFEIEWKEIACVLRRHRMNYKIFLKKNMRNDVLKKEESEKKKNKKKKTRVWRNDRKQRDGNRL